MSGKKIVLVHGYLRTHRDMRRLKKYMKELGYDAICVNLPLTFDEIDKAVEEFKIFLEDKTKKFKNEEKVTLAGHSTGGLVIRKLIIDYPQLSKYIDKIILIATPNTGNELAEFITEYFYIIPRIFKTLHSLHPESVKKISSLDGTHINIGAIAGNEPGIITRPFFKSENDGKVSVDSVKYEDIDDFIVLPYNHFEIHKRRKTAKYISSFIENGRFRI
ncbi:esterase/lipase family protein [Senegalia massiliensis]|uniref:esterase/lipase family protein n=1 Tax=Senegalia massiliensis TaxID=1720316 RepID=UPI001031166A|nr:alpha/beta hydrolase [Senegalia massiliensis]